MNQNADSCNGTLYTLDVLVSLRTRDATALFVPHRLGKKADGNEKAKKNVIVAAGNKPPGVQAWIGQKTC